METTSGTTDGGSAGDEDRRLHDPDRDRDELLRAESVRALLSYAHEPAPGGGIVRDLRSTIVDPDHGGEGLGSRLVRFALDDVRAHGGTVVATCWFAAGWIARHDDYADLLAPQDPAR